MRRISIALSTSPCASVRAFLQSIIPAPVRSRRAFTSWAAISTVFMMRSSPLLPGQCPCVASLRRLLRCRLLISLCDLQLRRGWRYQPARPRAALGVSGAAGSGSAVSGRLRRAAGLGWSALGACSAAVS